MDNCTGCRQVNQQGPIPAVLSVVADGDADAVVLVRRRNPPDAGLWGFPGGKIRWQESLEAAAARELWEETGLRGLPHYRMPPLEVMEHECDGSGYHFLLLPVLCHYLSGTAIAGDDALEACWFRRTELRGVKTFMSFDVVELALDALSIPERRPSD